MDNMDNMDNMDQVPPEYGYQPYPQSGQPSDPNPPMSDAAVGLPARQPDPTQYLGAAVPPVGYQPGNPRGGKRGLRRGVLVGIVAAVLLALVAGGVAFAAASSRNPATASTPSASQPAAATSKHMAVKTGRPTYTVTSVSGLVISATKSDGTAVTITTTATTTFTRAGVHASLSDVTSGVKILAEGKTASDGNVSAKKVAIVVPAVAGKATAINGDTITLTTKAGPKQVTVGTSTTIVSAQTHSAIQLATIQVGAILHVQGITNGDGSITALRIVVGAAHGTGASPAATATAGA